MKKESFTYNKIKSGEKLAKLEVTPPKVQALHRDNPDTSMFVPLNSPIAAKLTENINQLDANNLLNSFDTRQCYELCYQRVRNAITQVTGDSLPDIWKNPETEKGYMKRSITNEYSVISGNKFELYDKYEIDNESRGKGVVGLMVDLGYGTEVSKDEIMQGRLEPGATMQIWTHMSDYQNVVNGLPPSREKGHYGHSFIFRSYIRDRSGKIIGMKAADQDFLNDIGDIIFSDFNWQFMVGANFIK